MKVRTRRFFCYFKNIPRLEAEESLTHIMNANIAFNGSEGNETKQYMRELQERAKPARPEGAEDSNIPADNPMLLATMGIKLIKLDKRPEGERQGQEQGSGEGSGGDGAQSNGGQQAGGTSEESASPTAMAAKPAKSAAQASMTEIFRKVDS